MVIAIFGNLLAVLQWLLLLLLLLGITALALLLTIPLPSPARITRNSQCGALIYCRIGRTYTRTGSSSAESVVHQAIYISSRTITFDCISPPSSPLTPPLDWVSGMMETMDGMQRGRRRVLNWRDKQQQQEQRMGNKKRSLSTFTLWMIALRLQCSCSFIAI